MADKKYLDHDGVKYLAQKIYTRMDNADANKVDKVTGKGLSTNDYTTNEKSKLSGIATGAQVNVIETIKVNGTAQTVSSKAVNITVPTDNATLANGAGYQTASQVNSAINSAVGKITGISFEVVTSLPKSGTAGRIYLMADKHSDANDNYDEYIYYNSAWEKIGNTDVDLSNYLQKTDVSALSNTDIDNALASL